MDDYTFSVATDRGLKDFFLSYFNTYRDPERSKGQLIHRPIPPGIEIKKIKTLPVRLIRYDSGNLEVVGDGMPTLERLWTIYNRVTERKEKGITVPVMDER